MGCTSPVAGDEPASETRSWGADRIQYALASQGDPLRRDALAACDRFREELAPQLLETPAWWSNEPAAALEEDGSLGHHALYLLARWRESSAWPVVQRLVARPDADRYELLGDFITEDTSVVLAMIVGGQSDELRAMVEDDVLDEYTRVADLPRRVGRASPGRSGILPGRVAGHSAERFAGEQTCVGGHGLRRVRPGGVGTPLHG